MLPYDPYQQDLSVSFQGPSPEHWFGTDQQGRDIFCRILVGSQISLTVGLLSVAISLTIGVTLGAVAGYKGGVVDTVIMRVMDMMLAIPSILLAIAFMAALAGHRQGHRGHRPRVHPRVRAHRAQPGARGQAVRLRRRRPRHRRLRRNHHLSATCWPNVMPSIIVRATLGISSAILDAAALGFLGLGVQPPAAEWGDMLGRGRNYIFSAPHAMIFPASPSHVTVLAFNLLGDGIRDAFDPKSRNR